MLRNNYVYKYRNRNQFEAENKYAQDDDNFILKSNRPLNDKAISELPSKHLQTFVDEILTNKKVSNLLYSSNAKSEIKMLVKSNDFMKANRIKSHRKQHKNNPMDIVKNRNRNETIALIKTEAVHF